MFQFVQLPLFLSLGTTENSQAPSSLRSPFRYLYTLSPLFLAQETFLSLSSVEGCSRLLTICKALHWPTSSMSMSLSLSFTFNILYCRKTSVNLETKYHPKRKLCRCSRIYQQENKYKIGTNIFYSFKSCSKLTRH